MHDINDPAGPALPPMPIPAIHRRVPQYLARRFWQIAATFQSEAIARHGLSAPWHAALLVQLRDTPGMDRNWLAAAIGVDATSAGQALAAFEARGAVSRMPHPRDGRANAFALTAAGQALVVEVVQESRRVATRLLAPLAEAEATLLLDLLARLVDAHDPYARPGAGRRPPRRAISKGEP
jgi:DNA-binding MarR family transcriptional regulator